MNEVPGCKIICPNKWYSEKHLEIENKLIPESWIKIDPIVKTNFVSNCSYKSLGNRLNILISDMRLYDEIYKDCFDEFKVLWGADCESMKFNKLFANFGDKIVSSISDSDFYLQKGKKYTGFTREPSGFSLIAEKDAGLDLKSYYKKYDGTLYYCYDKTPKKMIDIYLKYIGKLEISEEVLKKVESVSRNFNDKTIGVHIRLGDFNKYVERKVEIDRFIARMIKLIREDVGHNFYISCDDPEMIKRLVSLFGEDIIHYFKHRYDKHHTDYITAFVCILLLGKCRRLICTNMSTFSQLGWYFGGAKASVEVISNKYQEGYM